jgi:hypothetical protein
MTRRTRLPAFGKALAERRLRGEHCNVRVHHADDFGWNTAKRHPPGDVLLLDHGCDPYALHWPVAGLEVLVVLQPDELARRTCAALIHAGASLAVAVPFGFVHRAEVAA